MAAAVFLIAIMGCGEGEAPCQQLRLLDTRYESQAACVAATEAAVTRFMDADYPVIVAQCRPSGAASALRPADVRLPEPEATPHFPRN
ncbi:MAG TPA: hypothetical protein VNT77_08845 [Allosphingosinicella sp.]|nr:hypothetical protein [Allosphingosinicella sp.]